MHILLLTNRDWTHPQDGGSGTHSLVTRWLALGHRVTVIAQAYPGCQRVEQLDENLVIHRMGSRLTVVPRAAWATWRGIGRDADVVLEVIDGVAFLTPFWRWLRVPRVALVRNVHRRFWLERVPLRYMYALRPVITVSNAVRTDLVELGVAPERIHVIYPGVEPPRPGVGPRSPEPTLVYVGRPAAKHRDSLLDVLSGIPEAQLEIAGADGPIDEQARAELYARSWLNVTASAAEGWSPSVMEAATYGTPSAGLAVGGLPEAIVDGQTGVLADTPDELRMRVGELVRDRARCEELGEAARARARGFTWEHAAQATLELLEKTAAGGHVRMRNLLRESETGKAIGLAAATLANNAIQLAFTIVFVRLLGTSGYGSLAALISAFLILLIGGQSVQAAAARELTLGRLGSNAQTSHTLRVWTTRIIGLLVAVSVFSVILRDPISRVIGVANHPWAAAAVLPTGALWMLLSLQRGALQGMRAFKPLGTSLIAEAALRIVFGLLLVAAGLGVTGAYLGTPLAFAGTSVAVAIVLHRRLAQVPGAPHEGKVRSLRSLIGQEWVPVMGLLCLGVLQNVDVIMGRHVLTHHQAGIYASAAVAAKAVLWVAIGLGLHLLPEATRRGAAALDPRPVLYRALGVLGMVAAPALLIFWLVPSLVLGIAFGHQATGASSELVLLGLAMTLLAVAYLTVMYMIALGENQFLWVVAVVAILEPIVLGSTEAGLYTFAAIVLGVQCLAASGVLILGLSARFRAVPGADRRDARVA